MNVDFDPLSSLIAMLALGISIWAVVVAKREPHRARTRSTRDSIRQELLDAKSVLRRLSDSLDTGRDLPDDRSELASICEALKTYAPRVPEEETLEVIWGWLKFVNSYWLEVGGKERSLKYLRERRRKFAEAQDAIAVTSYDDQIATATRGLNASITLLREKITTAEAAIDPYLGRINTADRVGRDLRS